MKTKDIIAEILSLPVEKRAIVADSILKSLSPPESEIDKNGLQLQKNVFLKLHLGE